MIPEIRPASAADAPAIARVRREVWFAAYSEIIDPAIIARVTVDRGGAETPPAYRTSLVAAGPPDGEILGYASYGPERAMDGSGGSASLTPAGLAGETGELYAIYVASAAWSTGAGRALMDAALGGLRAAGFRRVVLWTLRDNARARRFYDKAGLAPDGATNILTGLGGIEELRYARAL